MQTKKDVLVIDDNELLLDLLKAFLERDGYEVETCSSPASALALAEERPFDIYIIDYQLPEMCGDAVAVAIRRLQPSAIIIGSSAESKEKAFLSAGADTFISKDHVPTALTEFLRGRNSCA